MIVGLDVGYSAVKGLCGERRCLFPAVVGTPAPEGAFSMFHNQKLLAVSDNGKFTPVGETALLQSNYATGRRDPEWVLSEDWLTLFQAALSELVTVPAATVQLVTGLPVGDWRRFAKPLKERLLAQFSFRRAGRGMQTITIADVLVVTQPYGSLLDMALGPAGEILNNVWSGDGLVGVIDIGGNTMNMLVTQRFEEVSRMTASVEFGLLHALDEVCDVLRQQFPHFSPATHEVSEWLAGGMFRYGGQEQQLWPYAEPFLMPLVELIQSKVAEKWTQAGRFEAVLLTGGGAAILGRYLRPCLREFASVTLASNSRWANVQGYYKFGLREWAGG